MRNCPIHTAARVRDIVRMTESEQLDGSVLSLTADYAVRAVIALARARGRPLKAPEVAAGIGAPGNYLSKTLNTLAKHGIVSSRRGPTGGFTLAETPERLTLARIAEVFAERRTPARCLLADRLCSPDAPCAAHRHWSAVQIAARRPLRVTIAELLADDPVEL